MSLDNLAAIATIVGVALAVPAFGVTFAQLRLAQESARAQAIAALTTLVRDWDAPQMVRARRDVGALTSAQLREVVREAYLSEAASPDAADKAVRLLRVPNYFEGLAYATDQGAVSFQSVASTLSSAVLASWRQWQEAIAILRSGTADPSIYSEFEKLAGRLASSRF